MKVFKGLSALPKFKNAVLTIGTYDGVHAGHQAIIQKINEIARSIGGESIVLTFDPHPRIVLNKDKENLKLISTIDEKIELLDSFGLDNLVITPFSKNFASTEAKDYVRDVLVHYFQPAVIVIGYDHKFGKGRTGNINLLRALGPKYNFKVEEISAQTIHEISVSSTKVRNAIMESNIKEANTLLAHSFIIQGDVVHGDKIGRTIGFPTANLHIKDPYKLIPPVGVYAVWVEIGENKLKGALSISYRPTVKSDGELRVEVYILDFNQDIYGENLRLILVDFIRKDKKFDTLDELIIQMQKDVEQVRNVLN
ncbi:MAG TPA: bifunctional riboflavin kinase/FAD synthetase [Chitinophagales bacterium]|nr:bifunctional riboflavin kinase/FAD synthetase [Chitinophagales bacterium]